jgi:hypothetical protein
MTTPSTNTSGRNQSTAQGPSTPTATPERLTAEQFQERLRRAGLSDDILAILDDSPTTRPSGQAGQKTGNSAPKNGPKNAPKTAPQEPSASTSEATKDSKTAEPHSEPQGQATNQEQKTNQGARAKRGEADHSHDAHGSGTAAGEEGGAAAGTSAKAQGLFGSFRTRATIIFAAAALYLSGFATGLLFNRGEKASSEAQKNTTLVLKKTNSVDSASGATNSLTSSQVNTPPSSILSSNSTPAPAKTNSVVSTNQVNSISADSSPERKGADVEGVYLEQGSNEFLDNINTVLKEENRADSEKVKIPLAPEHDANASSAPSIDTGHVTSNATATQQHTKQPAESQRLSPDEQLHNDALSATGLIAEKHGINLEALTKDALQRLQNPSAVRTDSNSQTKEVTALATTTALKGDFSQMSEPEVLDLAKKYQAIAHEYIRKSLSSSGTLMEQEAPTLYRYYFYATFLNEKGFSQDEAEKAAQKLANQEGQNFNALLKAYLESKQPKGQAAVAPQPGAPAAPAVTPAQTGSTTGNSPKVSSSTYTPNRFPAPNAERFSVTPKDQRSFAAVKPVGSPRAMEQFPAMFKLQPPETEYRFSASQADIQRAYEVRTSYLEAAKKAPGVNPQNSEAVWQKAVELAEADQIDLQKTSLHVAIGQLQSGSSAQRALKTTDPLVPPYKGKLQYLNEKKKSFLLFPNNVSAITSEDGQMVAVKNRWGRVSVAPGVDKGEARRLFAAAEKKQAQRA